MDTRYPKLEKLKSKKQIEALFQQGKSIAVYPLRLVYLEQADSQAKLVFGVSVSKRIQKLAVERNYIKRLLRECYRHNKGFLAPANGYAFMLLYQSKEQHTYRSLKLKTALLFKKFVAVEKIQNPAQAE